MVACLRHCRHTPLVGCTVPEAPAEAAYLMFPCCPTIRVISRECDASLYAASTGLIMRRRDNSPQRNTIDPDDPVMLSSMHQSGWSTMLDDEDEDRR